jgi:hypothetical protein
MVSRESELFSINERQLSWNSLELGHLEMCPWESNHLMYPHVVSRHFNCVLKLFFFQNHNRDRPPLN